MKSKITDIIVDIYTEHSYVTVTSDNKAVSQTLSREFNREEDAIGYATSLAEVSSTNYVVRTNFGEDNEQEDY